MSVRKPAPGTALDDGDMVTAIVVTRGWTDAQIREAIADAYLELDDYELDVWRNCTRRWREAQGVDTGHDNYWHPEGDGASTIDVAVLQ